MWNIFKKKEEHSCEELQKENEVLKEKLEDSLNKLQEQQGYINKTNAYWKRKLKEAMASKKL